MFVSMLSLNAPFRLNLTGRALKFSNGSRGITGRPIPNRAKSGGGWKSVWGFSLLLILFCASSAPSKACDELASGTLFWVRLTAPVSSYTAKPGMPVEAFLLQAPECNNGPVFAAKIPVEGKVLSVHRVGLGLWHETAALEIEFFRLLPPGGSPIEIHARVMRVDYARESVKNGVIKGMRSTDTPQGRISSRLKYLPSFHLYPDPILLGYKVLFPVFPEPEITLEPGTDLQVELVETVKLPLDLPPVAQIPTLDANADLNNSLAELSERTFTKKGKQADVVNMVFAGSQADVEQAFEAADWHHSDAVSAHTVFHQFYSFLAKTSYPTAPMTAQFLDGRAPNLTLEKAPRSYENRNHVRIWGLEATWEGVPLWASAAVRETGGTLSIRHKGFVHHVSGDLDEEQQTVLRDLSVAGCVDSVASIARPGMAHVMRNATGELFHTDGSLEVVRLKPCVSDSQVKGSDDARSQKPRSWMFRFVRRQVLTVRSDLWRANCIYALFDLTRITVGAARRNAEHQTADARVSNPQSATPANATPLLPKKNTVVQAGTEDPDPAP